MSDFEFVASSDLEEFERGWRAFREGRMSEERFTPFRLQMGIYGQRQEGVQMVRIKLPGGRLSPDQLEVIADCVEEFSGRLPSDGSLKEAPAKLAHITTRQDIQMHFVDLADVPAILRRLASVGLTTREACGNTVRNVTACFLAGRCPAEHADVSVHARAFAQAFLRHPLTQQFPRKFKVNFSGCATDCGLSGMHDIGFIARVKDGRKGFQVWAAGGLSTQPMSAILLEDFIEEQEIFVVGEALMRMHFKYSDRKRRARARLKYVAQKLGAEGFVEEYRRQRAAIEAIHRRDKPVSGAGWREPNGSMPWSEDGVVRQHDGRLAILLNLFRGDLTPEQCRAIAAVAKTAGTQTLMVTAEQGLVIADIKPEDRENVLDQLQQAGLSTRYARGIADVVACPGSETCRLGITSSRGLAEAMRPVVDALKTDPTLAGLTVKASGCQHSCGRHHIADLGFHGLAKKIGGRAVPHYQLHVGGSGRAGESFAFATDPVPAKRAPEAGAAILQAYREGRLEGENMHDWAARIGREAINALLAPFAGEPGEIEGLVYDWNENEAFSTKGNKKGECAGAVLSMTDALVCEAEYEWMLARAHADAMFWGEAHGSLKRASVSLARAFLVPFGEAPEKDEDVWPLLIAHASSDAELLGGLTAVQAALMGVDLQEPAPGITRLKQAVGDWLKLAKDRFAPVPATPRDEGGEAESRSAPEETQAGDVPLLDLSGVTCPMNFVKTKIKLTSMPVGALLDVILDDGAPIENVPLSLEEQGQKVLSKEPYGNGQWKIRVQKTSEI
ncbi:MAG: sulfite reductase [Zetaproteobacteria bacterium]|nr:MAG: sulfite reductase [Zetaproteobacteria bacterium]